MKTFTLCLFLALGHFTIAQTKTNKIKAYTVIVITASQRIEGFLHSADASQLHLLEDVKKREPKLISVKSTDIRRIKIGRKGSIIRGALIGTAAGGVIGFAIGYSEGDDEPGWFSYSKETKAGLNAIVLGVLGGGVGTLIGSGKKKIDIDFNATKYLNNLNVIRHYSMVKIEL